MPVIYVNIQIFDGDQSIYLVNADSQIKLIAKAPLESLADVLTEQCYAKETYKVKLFSILPDLCKKIKRQVGEKENTKFNKNLIKIDINETRQ